VAGGGHFEAAEEVEELAACGRFKEVCVVLAHDVCCPADVLIKRNGSVKTKERKVGQSASPRRRGFTTTPFSKQE